MLECGKNFQGTRSNFWEECNEIDDEKHRINFCPKFQSLNNYEQADKVNFDLVFSNNIETLRTILPKIAEIWNTYNANGTMNVEWQIYHA